MGDRLYLAEKTCKSLSDPKNGLKIGNSYTCNDGVSFNCNSGYAIVGSSRLTCKTDGSWSADAPSCTGGMNDIGVCDRELAIYLTVVDRNECTDGTAKCPANSNCKNTLGSYICPCVVGYVKQSSGRCDIVNCSDPGTPPYGSRSGKILSYGSKLSFSCTPGYELMGAQFLSCQSDGTWNGNVPKCLGELSTKSGVDRLSGFF